MIQTILKDKKVILASASPRRRQIFKFLGLKVLYKAANIDESVSSQTELGSNSLKENPRKFVLLMSKKKAKKIAEAMDADCVVVAADTVVYIDDMILSKPENRYQAADYLTRLSGRSHYVYTGVTVCYRRKCISDFERTAVTFSNLTAKEISDYIETGESDDKAGAYGIQGFGSQFIRKVNGCYFNVMGFPVAKFYNILKRIF